jgi:hypothetical protein
MGCLLSLLYLEMEGDPHGLAIWFAMLHIMKYPLRMMAVISPYFTIIMKCHFILIITMSCGDVEEIV